jgi:hypothetical protein
LNEVKFTPDAYGVFRMMEALSLSIEGKLLLWQTLSSQVEMEPALHNLAFDNMMERAKKQRAEIETQRVMAAQAAFRAAIPA